MRYEEVLELRRRDPFQPFRVHTKAGRSFDVRHPSLLMVLPTLVVIGLIDSKEPKPIFDRYIDLPLTDVARCEPLALPQIAQGT